MKIISIFFLIILFSDLCYANPIVIGIPNTGKFSLDTGTGLMINFAADFLAVFIGYMIIKKIKTLFNWRFLPYLAFVFLGGIIIDILAFVPTGFFFLIFHADHLSFLILFLLAGLFLYLFNSWLSEKLFGLELKEKIVVGFVMALLTNPVIGFIFSSFSIL